MSHTATEDDAKPARTRRTMNQTLDIRRTHLILRRGPLMAVCAHRRLGLFMGMSHEPRPLWSHEPWSLERLGHHHPDATRTAVSWPDPAQARADLVKWLSVDDWGEVKVMPAHADVSESPPPEGDPMAGPVMLCSIENCIRLVPHLKLLDRHRLEPRTPQR